MKIFLSKKSINRLGLFLCFALLISAGYLQFVEGVEPCPLCIIQRIVVVLLGLCFFIGTFIHTRSVTKEKVFYSFMIFIALVGAATAARQVWLQYFASPDQIASCGPNLDYMLKTLPLTETIRLLFAGTGDCAEIQWTFLNLSIPVWTLLAFLFFACLAFFNMSRQSHH